VSTELVRCSAASATFDRVGEVQIEARVLALDLARRLKQGDRDVRDQESVALRLEEDEVDKG
jgi:hypothetical protein